MCIRDSYGITPLTADFNLDGYPDLVFTNISGKIQAHVNRGGEANHIAYRIPETAPYVGAKVTVTRNDGTQLSDVYVIGEGLASDQTSRLTFGLGPDASIKAATVTLISGETRNLPTQINKTHKL